MRQDVSYVTLKSILSVCARDLQVSTSHTLCLLNIGPGLGVRSPLLTAVMMSDVFMAICCTPGPP